jgi:dipeptidyl aminopeptidase/acylaminoacyl peptidase
MSSPTIAAYGSWKSPITSDLIVAGTIGVSQCVINGDDIYWIEVRPNEGGRSVIVRQDREGKKSDITPRDFNSRTRVHEYGGGDYLVVKDATFFSNFSDQRIYRRDPDGEVKAITSESETRFADYSCDDSRNRLICVREDHSTSDIDAVNTLVAVDPSGDVVGRVLVEGFDFFSNPRVSPDGNHLAWLAWNHPNMPWDGSEVWIGDFASDGSINNAKRIGGGDNESIFQPEWSPDGLLHFISDRSGWWNLYRANADGKIESLFSLDAEFGVPQWVFGLSTYAFVSASQIVATYSQRGVSRLAMLDLSPGNVENIETRFTDISYLRAQGNRIIFRGGTPTESAAIVEMNLETRETRVLKRASDLKIDEGYISVPESIEFPTQDGKTAHAIYYAPHNRDFVASEGEQAPLLVKSHGGPTSAATATLKLEIQYWTSRGFAVLDVNYGGSSGYGREYRERLNDTWGIVDVDDCVNGAKYLIGRGLADPNRCAIDGGSAGGYTTLCALTFSDTFKAGASHYGVSDLEALTKETHKFESRYLDRLIGPYPEKINIYRERSPIHHTDRLSCPLIFFQGLEDKIVLPNQAEMMVDALRAKGLPVAYVPFEGEQHGFRRAQNIKCALDGELYFYSRVFGFDLADAVEPVVIENLT